MFLTAPIFLAVRVVQAVFAIIILGLTAYVAHWWSGYWHAYSPSEVNFLIFAAVWTLLALLYLTLTSWRFAKFSHKFAVLAVEAVTMIFWFAGFIALAVFLSDRVCYGSVCACAKAATVFAAFEWLLFAITTAHSTMHVLSTRGTNQTKGPAPHIEVHQGV